MWVLVTLLPTLMLNTTQREAPLGRRDYIGWGLWLAGMIIEAMADMQKSAFRSNLENEVGKTTQYCFHGVFGL